MGQTTLLLLGLTGVLTIASPAPNSAIPSPPGLPTFAAGNTPDGINVEGHATNHEECGRLEDECVGRCTALPVSDECISEASRKATQCYSAVAKNGTFSFSFVYGSDGAGKDQDEVGQGLDFDDASLFGNFSSISRAAREAPPCPWDQVCYWGMASGKTRKEREKKCGALLEKSVNNACKKWKSSEATDEFGLKPRAPCTIAAARMFSDCKFEVRKRDYEWNFKFNTRYKAYCDNAPHGTVCFAGFLRGTVECDSFQDTWEKMCDEKSKEFKEADRDKCWRATLLLLGLTGVLTIASPTPDSAIPSPPSLPKFAVGNTPDGINVEGHATNHEECGRLEDESVARCTALPVSDGCISQASSKAAECHLAVERNGTFSVYSSDGTGKDLDDVDADDAFSFGNLSSISRAASIPPPCPKHHVCNWGRVTGATFEDRKSKCGDFSTAAIQKCKKWNSSDVKDKYGLKPRAACNIAAVRLHYTCVSEVNNGNYVWDFKFNTRYKKYCDNPPIGVVCYADFIRSKKGCDAFEVEWEERCKIRSQNDECIRKKNGPAQECRRDITQLNFAPGVQPYYFMYLFFTDQK
ncbi:hypothetical protein HDU96_009788 [Phlyctochytrium bullatum]|nr:hypothetical protein HDU96_009788 [Phlyctochytrium bullatum]